MMERRALSSPMARFLLLAFWYLLVLVSSVSAQPRGRLPPGLLEIYEKFSRTSVPPIPAPQRPIRQKGEVRKEEVDSAFPFLEVAYNALRAEDFDKAIAYFNQAVAASPNRTDIRKDLGYTYYKVGSDDQALQQFQRVTQLDPTDYQSALEVAFVTYQSPDPGQLALARRIFDQVRQAGDPVSKATAEQAFENIDSGLAAQIASLQQALQLDPNNLIVHFQLGQAAEERGDFQLSIDNYTVAEGLNSGAVYIDLARVLHTAGRTAEERAALIQATQLGMSDPYSAEAAKDQLQKLGGD